MRTRRLWVAALAASGALAIARGSCSDVGTAGTTVAAPAVVEVGSAGPIVAAPGAVEVASASPTTAATVPSESSNAGPANPTTTSAPSTAPPVQTPKNPSAEYVPGTEDAFPRIRYSDSLVSLNDRCPVRHAKLNLKLDPIYVNGQPIGFC